MRVSPESLNEDFFWRFLAITPDLEREVFAKIGFADLVIGQYFRRSA
jgi:hypothetical protein